MQRLRDRQIPEQHESDELRRVLPGRFSEGAGARECDRARPNTTRTRADQRAVSSALPKGAEYTSSIGATACDICKPEYYMDDDGACIAKPEGVVVDTAATTLESMKLKKGWFRFSSTSAEVYKCPRRPTASAAG